MLMQIFRSTRRRSGGSRSIGRSPESCESRMLLSATTGKVVATAAPPADFSGPWEVTTNQGNSFLEVLQSGAYITVLFHAPVVNVNAADGSVKGNVAKVKYKVPQQMFLQNAAGPPALTLKMKIKLTDANHFVGKAKGKTELGKFNLKLDGTRQAN
ncbi:MAG: hypothetical protein KDA68_09610 [Planctomycetaceae bacterium]|nr:hypothetical protein [Planctomycetaceae bacterium]